MPETPPHPCPFPASTVERIAAYLPLDIYPTVIDPFAGIGRIHSLPQFTYGVEIEPEWAEQTPPDAKAPWMTKIGDALNLGSLTFSAAATSPCFGNRMADHHNARDESARNTYRHKLGRPLTEGSSAGLQWGPEYRDFHRAAWKELARVVKPGGRFVLNIKNHIRAGVEMRVAEWHMTTLIRQGWKMVALEVIDAPGIRHGANHALRTEHEYLVVVDATWTRIG